MGLVLQSWEGQINIGHLDCGFMLGFWQSTITWAAERYQINLSTVLNQTNYTQELSTTPTLYKSIEG